MGLYSMQDLFSMHAVIGYGHGGNDGGLPRIQMIYLSDGYIEPVPQPVFEAFDDMPLFLQ